MTPKFYSYLWTVFAATALIFWLGGVFTMMTLVVYGFIAFGLVFTGMICVLPGLAAHPPAPAQPSPAKPEKRSALANAVQVRFP